MSRHIVASVSEIPEGERKLVVVKGRPIAIFNVKGEYFALLNRCPHQGGRLCTGRVVGLVESDGPGDYRFSRQGEIIRCPWHGWEFDLRTGRSLCRPNVVGTKAYDTDIATGSDVPEGVLVAETFQVQVDENYVLVEV